MGMVDGKCLERGSNEGRNDKKGSALHGYMTKLYTVYEPKYALSTWLAILNPSRDTT